MSLFCANVFSSKQTVLIFFKSPIFLCIALVFCSKTLAAQNLLLNIAGKDSLQTSTINTIGYKNTFTDYKSLATEVKTLYTKLQGIGYINAFFKPITKQNDSLYFTEFHLNTKYDSIYVYYDTNHISKTILSNISDRVTPNYFSIAVTTIEKSLEYLSSKIIENGRPFASLKLENISINNAQILKADLVITHNKTRTLSNIVVKGYEKFPKSYLKHYLKIKTNRVFNLNEIKTKTKVLNTLRFANQTKPPEVLFTQDSTAVYLYLEKLKNNTFDGFLGFGTNETTNRLEFDGFLDLKLTNNLNYGESASLQYKNDENDQVTFEVKFSLPYLFNSPIGAELSLQIFRQDSIFSSTKQSASLFYQVNSSQKIYAGIDFTSSTNLLDINTDSNLQDFNTTHYNLRYEYRSPQFNNLLFPVGFLFDIKAGLGRREFEDLSESQSIFNLNSFKIISLNTKNSFYIRANAGLIVSDSFLTNELLRFGGINSIRGFEENSIIASLYGIINTEYRYQLNSSLYLHSIVDVAYFEDDISNIQDNLFGFGFGFGLVTKAGLLRFNYANGRRDNQNFRLSDSKVHLSLNTRF